MGIPPKNKTSLLGHYSNVFWVPYFEILFLIIVLQYAPKYYQSPATNYLTYSVSQSVYRRTSTIFRMITGINTQCSDSIIMSYFFHKVIIYYFFLITNICLFQISLTNQKWTLLKSNTFNVILRIVARNRITQSIGLNFWTVALYKNHRKNTTGIFGKI